MKVKCVKTSISVPDRNVINGNMREYLTVGSIFWVYGISFNKGVTYLYIYDDDHLVEVPLELFEIIENKISSEWVFKVRKNGEVSLWPELFFTEDFIENFAEREDKEREEFNSLRKIVEQ